MQVIKQIDFSAFQFICTYGYKIFAVYWILVKILAFLLCI